MTWIATVPYAASTGRLRQLYDRIKGPGDVVDNIMAAHSLRPHSMDGHMALYKNVLHHGSNTLPKWFLESLGVLVSLANQCGYCVEHHFAGLTRLVGDEAKARRMRAALETREFSAAYEAREDAALRYALKLTLSPAAMVREDVEALRRAGFDDGQILEINQIVAYFAYANRTVLGLGIDTVGDILGLSPGNSDNPDDWSHR